MKWLRKLALLLIPFPCFSVTGVTLFDNGTNYMQIKAPSTYSSTYTLIVPNTPGVAGQVLSIGSVSGKTLTGTFATPSGGGSSSSLAVSQNGVHISSPTSEINLLSPPFTVTLSASGTSQIVLDASSVTLQGQNVVRLTSSLQQGATFYVSSGTVNGNLAIGNQLTVGGPIVGNGAYLTNVPIMSPSSTAPFPGPTVGSVEITGPFDTSDTVFGYKASGTSILRRNGNTLIVGNNNAGSASSTMCIGDSSCSNLDSSGARSVIIGHSAAQADMAEENTCVGYGSCQTMTTNRNSCFGAFACNALTSGKENTAIGWDAMPRVNTGSDNVCIGLNACDLMTSGYSNMIIGDSAGADITTGVRNVCMGGDTSSVQPCTGIVSGSSNTAVGAGALGNTGFIGTESKNTALGYGASVGVGVSNSVAIGYGVVAQSSNTVQIGTSGMTVNISSAIVFNGNVIISSTVIDGSGSSGTSGQFLKSNGPGTTVSWGSASAALLGSTSTWTAAQTFNSTITVVAIIGSGTPTISTGTGAGTIGSPTASISGKNMWGQVTVNSATTPATSSVVATITQSIAMPTKWVCVLFPANAVTGLLSGASMVLVDGTTSTWTITSGASGLTGASTYVWDYSCGGY